MGGRQPSPPRLAALLVRLLPADGNEAFLAGDMEQEFDELAATAGIAAARRWYWKQACLSVRPLIGRHVSSTIDRAMRHHSRGRNRTMQALGNDLRYAWRMARRSTHRHGLGDAGDCAGHRREHRHVQRDGRGLPPSVAVPGAGSARAVQHDGRTLRRCSGGELPRRAGLAIISHASRTARPLRCRAGNRTACSRCPAIFGNHHGRDFGCGACARHPRTPRTAAAAGGVPIRRPGKRDARVPILAVALRQRSVRGGPIAATRHRATDDCRRAGLGSRPLSRGRRGHLESADVPGLVLSEHPRIDRAGGHRPSPK